MFRIILSALVLVPLAASAQKTEDEKLLERPKHARHNSKHLRRRLARRIAGRATEGPREMGIRPQDGGSPSRREGFGRAAYSQHQRSTSPRTMSIEPRIATASATSRSLSSHGRICKFTNEGPRIFARNGFGLRPSLIM